MNNKLSLFKMAGSKRSILNTLYKHFPRTFENFLDCMGGTYVVSLNLPIIHRYLRGDIPKTKLPIICINDIDSGISCLGKSLILEPKKVYESANNMLRIKDLYQSFKELEPKNEFEMGIKKLYILSFSFGGQDTSSNTFGYHVNRALDYPQLSGKEYLQKVVERLKLTQIFGEDYWEFITRFMYKMNDGLIYFDPPYYKTDGAGSDNFFEFDHNLLAERIDIIHEEKGGKILLSYNDCDFIRERYSNYKIVEIENKYKIDVNDNNKIVKELLIMNYKDKVKTKANLRGFIK